MNKPIWKIEIKDVEENKFQIVRSNTVGTEILAELNSVNSDLSIKMAKEWAKEIVELWNNSRVQLEDK